MLNCTRILNISSKEFCTFIVARLCFLKIIYNQSYFKANGKILKRIQCKLKVKNFKIYLSRKFRIIEFPFQLICFKYIFFNNYVEPLPPE